MRPLVGKIPVAVMRHMGLEGRGERSYWLVLYYREWFKRA